MNVLRYFPKAHSYGSITNFYVINRFKHTKHGNKERKLKENKYCHKPLLENSIPNLLSNLQTKEIPSKEIPTSASSNIQPPINTTNINISKENNDDDIDTLYKSYIIPCTLGTSVIGGMLSILVENLTPLVFAIPIGVCAGMFRNKNAKKKHDKYISMLVKVTSIYVIGPAVFTTGCILIGLVCIKLTV